MNIENQLFFMNFTNPKTQEDFRNGKNKENYSRIAYIPFGLPKNMVEGILVGRKYEKNNKILNNIKNKFPQAYLCNLDGKVIKE
jgi:hypothetical protein